LYLLRWSAWRPFSSVLLIMELLIQLNFISRFIVPPPSEIVGSFGRVIVEEHVFTRFLLTLGECLTAGVMLTVFGIAGGVLMHRIKLFNRPAKPGSPLWRRRRWSWPTRCSW
jgi:ABC-type nitrate/sulfonate/bicarbonate transport system permease component